MSLRPSFAKTARLLNWRPTGLGRARANRALGLDIGPGAVNLVALGWSARGAIAVTACERSALAPGVVVEGQIEQFEELRRVVQSLVARLERRPSRVAMALPTPSVILRRAHFRAGLGQDELAAFVEGEAATWAPFPLDELALDFTVVGAAAGVAGEVEVLMAAARQDRVQARQALAQAAGLNLSVIDTESNAALLALRAWRPPDGQLATDEALALMDLGPGSITLRVMAEGDIAFEREHLGSFGQDLAPGVLAVSRLLQFFQAGHPGRRVVGVALAGEVACRSGVAPAVARMTGLPVWVMDPFAHLSRGEGLAGLPDPQVACAYVQACGLALRAWAS